MKFSFVFVVDMPIYFNVNFNGRKFELGPTYTCMSVHVARSCVYMHVMMNYAHFDTCFLRLDAHRSGCGHLA